MKTVKSDNCCYDSPTAPTQFVFASIIQSANITVFKRMNGGFQLHAFVEIKLKTLDIAFLV